MMYRTIMMGKVTIEFRGFKSEAELDDDIVEKVYKALPTLAERGQTILSEIKPPKSQEKPSIQKPLITEDLKFPTNEDVRDFIKTTSPNYEFTLSIVCKHFIGFTPSSIPDKPERRIYDRMWTRIRKAKELIENEEKGEWKSTTGKEGETIYKFEKSVQEA